MGDFFFSVPQLSWGSMLKRKHRVQLRTWRVLPPRSEQFSAGSGILALPPHTWFTPEVIIFDAFSVAADLLWFWGVFRKALPAFTFRTAALALLGFVIFGFNNNPGAAVANNYSVPQLKEAVDLQITTKISAGSAPTIAWPVTKAPITTHFSFYHQGVDIPKSWGTPVKAYSGGKVVFAGWDGGFGKIVVIKHENGLVSKYAHLSSITVRKGEAVAAGTFIGRVGTTGFATGAHLHFEIHGPEGPMNPLSVLP